MELKDYSNILSKLADLGATEVNPAATSKIATTVFETSIDDGPDSV